uniref:NADH-ubiquinone oxidoreductase chain 4L n=1 Tax=Dypsocus coleoptratus TaxID=297941 RepID=A0A8K1ZFC6_9NEOP|nr:NADH dehydrogenase subunit 4L [Dypsocus coleoptratus]
MLLSIIMIIYIMFLSGIYSFYMKSNYLLNMLLSLEYLSMIIYLLLFCFLWSSMEKFILVYFLTFCVCEGAFGISILVSLVRSAGNDYLQTLMFVKC